MAVAGALAAWALANFERDSWISTYFFLVACALAVAATVLMCWLRESDDPAKNDKTVPRRVLRNQDSTTATKQRKGKSGKALGP